MSPSSWYLLSFCVINIIIVQAENPHLRIFVLYLLRDPRASLADIKVKHMKEVLFGLMLYKSELVMCIFPSCVFIFSGFGEVQGERRKWSESVWKLELQDGAFTIIIIVSEAHCHHQLILSNNVMKITMFEIGI